ncbi:FAD/NAD(P)-binding domain-containing protein [Whalleya microplaca]|nr:FAD/NAD(P)-binding domain-containing protein [Whalleya microplaca]
MLKQTLIIAKALGFAASFLLTLASRNLSFRLRLLRHHLPPSSSSSKDSNSKPATPRSRNIVIIGASMAGYTAARTLASSLLPGSEYRVVVVEPHSHFHFTWVLPRFSVLPGHDHKVFIPYGTYLRGAGIRDGALRWVRDRVVAVTRESVRLAGGEELGYAFLVVASGAGYAGIKAVAGEEQGVGDGLPSRVGEDEKEAGMRRLREMQGRIRDAADLVVVGGGAAGVELAADTKALYPEKRVTLVHSREQVMHRFGARLRTAAMEGLKGLGVGVITGERVVEEDRERGVVVLRSGREVQCDFMVNCAGQKPDSQLLAQLSPESIAQTGHIRVKPTLQIQDDSLPNIYACGDVAETHVANPNSRSAMRQAMVAAYNVLDAVDVRQPRLTYEPHWAEGGITLTMGLENSINYFGDENTQLMFQSKDKDPAHMAAHAWKRMGAKPYEDDTSFIDKVNTDGSTTTDKSV